MIHRTSCPSVGCSSSLSAHFVSEESKVHWQFRKHGGTGGGGRVIIREGRHAIERSIFLGEDVEARNGEGLHPRSSRNSHEAVGFPNMNDGPIKKPVVALERRQSSLDSWPDDGSPRVTRWDTVRSRPKEQWKPSKPARKVAESLPRDADDRVSDDRRPAEGIDQGRHDADAAVHDGPVQPIQQALEDAKKKAIEVADWVKNLRNVNPQQLFSSTGERAPIPPFPASTSEVLVGLGVFFLAWLVLDAFIWRISRAFTSKLEKASEVDDRESLRSRAPSALSVLLDRDLRRKESVEWVNMVIGKFWNLYRRVAESYLVELLQPIIDDLAKPDIVKKVEVQQFFLGDEPLTVRTVERRTSRRADDLQYHIGVRYTGGARLLLAIRLKAWIIPITIPVGVRGLDVDAEIWVKLRMVPYEPWIGQVTWAFVTLPKIKLALAPFRILNLMSIPFLSIFLAKLLTEDLPIQFVRPNKNVINLLEGRAVGPLSKDFKDGAMLDGTRSFAGELSVTLIEARRLFYIPYLKTDPYCIFVLGEQVRRSKRNSQTSIIGPPGAPVWNQDFKLLVVDQKGQHLSLTLHDTLGFTSYPIGSADIDLKTLQDTVPIDRKVTLKTGWGPFPRRFVGELIVRLTYKAYIDEDGEDEIGGELTPKGSAVLDVPGAVEQVQEVATFFKEEAGKVAEFFQDKGAAKEMFSSLPTISSDADVEKALPILGLEPGDGKKSDHSKSSNSAASGNGSVLRNSEAVSKSLAVADSSSKDRGGKSNGTQVKVSNSSSKDGGGKPNGTQVRVSNSSSKDRGGKPNGTQIKVSNSSSNGRGGKPNGSQVKASNKAGEKAKSTSVESVSTSQLVVGLAVATGIIWIVAADLNLTNLLNP